MKHYFWGGMILLWGLASCGLARPPQASPQASVIAKPSQSDAASTVISPSAAPVPSASPTPTAEAIGAAATPGNSPPTRPVATPTIERDFAPTMPLPDTGQVTVRGNIRQVASDRMITQCPSDSAPYAFAESTHYLVQICSAEYDPWLPKYYMSRAKDGSGNLELTNDDPHTAQQLIFPNGDYTYVLDRDNAHPNQTNAYLEVHAPDGQIYAEALLYFYEPVDRPTP